jgi:hypothetical protein
MNTLDGMRLFLENQLFRMKSKTQMRFLNETCGSRVAIDLADDEWIPAL